MSWRFRLDVPPVSMHAAPDDSFLLVADVFGTPVGIEYVLVPTIAAVVVLYGALGGALGAILVRIRVKKAAPI